MNKRTKNIILFVAFIQILAIAGLVAMPRVVRALPGLTYVRLQNHPLTSGVMELITTPLPTALPAPDSAPAINVSDIPEIPGLIVVTPPATPTAHPTAVPTTTSNGTTPQETAVPVATAAPTFTPTPLPTMPPPPTQVTIEGLTTVKQGFNNCGPANLTIVLNHFGDDTTQEIAASYLKPNKEDRNVSPWQISDYVNEFTGLRSTVHSGGDLAMIKQFIAAGFPVVIEKGYEPNNAEGWYGHYLTVYGYDDDKQEIYTRDTNLGPFDGRPRIDNYDEFVYWWQQFNYTFYVVYQPEEEQQVMSILPPQLITPMTMWQYTADIARREVAADSENVFALFNLGVSLTRLGEITGDPAYYEGGADQFDAARTIGLPPRTLYYEHRPFMAYFKIGRVADIMDLTDTMLATAGGPWVEEIHYYRGHALSAQGRLTEAQNAYAKALEVNENFYPAQWALDWVNSELNG